MTEDELSREFGGGGVQRKATASAGEVASLTQAARPDRLWQGF